MPASTAPFNVILTGDKELDRALKNFRAANQKKVIRPALRKAAKSVTLSRIKQLIDQVPYKIGHFKSFLRVRATPRIRTSFGSKVGWRPNAEFETKDKKYYKPALFESGAPGRKKGYGNRRTASGANRGRIRPFAFMRRGLYGRARSVKAVVISEMKRQLPLLVAKLRAGGKVL